MLIVEVGDYNPINIGLFNFFNPKIGFILENECNHYSNIEVLVGIRVLYIYRDCIRNLTK